MLAKGKLCVLIRLVEKEITSHARQQFHKKRKKIQKGTIYEEPQGIT